MAFDWRRVRRSESDCGGGGGGGGRGGVAEELEIGNESLSPFTGGGDGGGMKAVRFFGEACETAGSGEADADGYAGYHRSIHSLKL